MNACQLTLVILIGTALLAGVVDLFLQMAGI